MSEFVFSVCLFVCLSRNSGAYKVYQWTPTKNADTPQVRTSATEHYVVLENDTSLSHLVAAFCIS